MLADGLSFVARTSQPPLAVVSKAPLSKLVEVLRPVATRCRRRPRQYRKQPVAVATEIGGPKLLPAELNFATKASVCPPRTESKPPSLAQLVEYVSPSRRRLQHRPPRQRVPDPDNVRPCRWTINVHRRD